MELKLSGKKVLITGSSKGIGYGIAESFAKEGSDIFLVARNPDDLEISKSRLGEIDEKIEINTFVGDLTEEDTCGELVSRISKEWGLLDILINNLGSGKSVCGFDADIKEWEKVFQLNLFSSMELTRLLLPLLQKSKDPNIVFVGSIAGCEVLGAPYTYGAAKAALKHAVGSMSKDLGKEGIRVNLVSPGNIFFEGGTWDYKLKEQKKAVEDMIFREVPLGRFGEVQEIGDLICYLSSYRSNFIHGSNIVIDGGQTRNL
jgi:3-oxoacyl-[acyl-carrier protein] reductase